MRPLFTPFTGRRRLAIGLIAVLLAGCSSQLSTLSIPGGDGESDAESLVADGDAYELDSERESAPSDGDTQEAEKETEREAVAEAEDAPDGDADEADEESPAEAETPLTLSAVIPDDAPSSRATSIRLKGAGFCAGMSVRLGAASFTATTLSATDASFTAGPVPAAERGLKDVEISCGPQTALLKNGFSWLFDHDPIVFVHGYLGHAKDFDTMIARFKALGYPDDYLAAVGFKSNTASNIVNAQELADFVDGVLLRSGAHRVDMVAHSMGALASRWWIRFLGGGSKLRDYLSLAGVHHGNNLAIATYSFDEASKEVYPAYAAEDKSENRVQWELNGDPDSRDIDETPFGVEDGGRIHWNAVYSDSDSIVSPSTANCLNQASRNDCSDPINVLVHGVGHNALITDPNVFELTRGILLRHDPGEIP